MIIYIVKDDNKNDDDKASTDNRSSTSTKTVHICQVPSTGTLSNKVYICKVLQSKTTTYQSQATA